MNQHLLIFAWEYNGYHSVQGTALSKRPRQIAESFVNHGWEVTVIHRDQRGECGDRPFFAQTEASGVNRIAVKSTTNINSQYSNALLRKLETLYYVSIRGDRTFKWSADVIEHFGQLPLTTKPTYILGMFSPRVPLFLGNYFSRQLGVPWIADLQDPIYEGVSGKSWFFLRKWMRKVLRSAHAITHISPEWAAIDAARLGRNVHTVRHATANPVSLETQGDRTTGDAFRVFYGGSISADIQSLDLLRNVIHGAAKKGIEVKLVLAGNENARTLFANALGEGCIEYMGWLSPEKIRETIAGCATTLVVPWSEERVGIPSKFYELCAYPRPIWIAGYDLGAFQSLLQEWQHPTLKIGDAEGQLEAVSRAVEGDFSGMFRLESCKGTILDEAGLCAAFESIM